MPKAFAQITIIDQNDITVGATAPINPVKDQLWLDTSINPSQLKEYSGTAWEIVNEVIVSGRNLFIMNGVGKYAAGIVSTKTSAISILGYKISVTANPTDLIGNTIINLGTTLTISGKTNLTTVNIYYKFSNGIQTNVNVSVTNGKFSFNLKTPIGATNLNLGLGQYPFVSAYYLEDIDVKNGNKVVDWTPAPEDIDKVIADVATSITTQITQAKADIKITTDAISLKADKSEMDIKSNRRVGSFRYVRDWLNGSSANTGNHWCEIEVWVGATNIARGKVPTGSTTLTTPAVLTDGNTSHTPYVSGALIGWQWVQIDLGAERKDVDMVRVFHHWADARQYNHKLQVSTDGVVWVDLYNSDVSGTYVETAKGRTYVINESYTESRLATAEQSITPTAIIATVQATINTAQANAITSANTTASNTYATKSTVAQTDAEWRATFKSSGGYNLIKNGQFRRKSITGGDWWVWQSWVGVYNNFQSFSTHNTGIGVQNNTPNQGSFLSNEMELEPNTVYTFSATSRKEVNVKWGHFAIEFKRADGVTTNSVTSNGLVESFSFTTPADCVRGYLLLNHGGSTSTTDSFLIWLDNVQVVKGNTVLPYSPHPSEIYDGNTLIDGTGVTIKNGAIKVLDGAGNEVLKGDSSGISFSGRLQPRDNTIKLFGENCRIDGSAGAIRIQRDAQRYISVDNDYTRFFNGNSQNGTKYASVGTDWEGHTVLFGQGTMLKLLSSGSPSVQARWLGDTGYCMMQASSFTVSSQAEFKDNIEEPTDIDFVKILMETDIKKYNLKLEMDLVDKMPTVILPDGTNPIKADVKLGLILDDLTEDARALIHPANTEGADLYSMVSILWKINQEQEKRIEKLEQLLIM